MTPNRLSFPAAVLPYVGSPPAVFNSLLRVLILLITVLLPAVALGQDQPPAAAPPAISAPKASPVQPAPPAVVVAARVTNTPERARLIIDLSAPTQFAIVSLGDPDRIAVDVKADSLKFATPDPPAGSGLVASYSVAIAEPGRARTMLTLAGPAQVQQAYVLNAFEDQPARLVVDLVPDTEQAFAKRVATDAAVAGLPAVAAKPMGDNSTLPGGSAGPGQGGGAALATRWADPAIAAIAGTALPPPAGKAKPLIVLDPGHGGIDSGARANGIMEKDIVLAFALKLQKLLVATGRFDVALTRTDDTYLTLEQRVELARQNKADLFISLHADTFSQPAVHGTSIYTRDEQATDVLDKVLAQNENKFDIVAGFAVPRATDNPGAKLSDQVVNTLLDLMRRQMRKQSFMAAESMVSALQPSVDLRRFPVRQADFFVLQAPDVPSMLIELGFMSNTDDIANLTKPEWQDRVAAALARGIGAYFDEQADP